MPVVLFTLATGIIGGLGVFTPYWMVQGYRHLTDSAMINAPCRATAWCPTRE